MTILGPILIAVFYGIMIYIVVNDELGQEKKDIAVVDRQGIFKERMESTDLMNFIYSDSTISSDPTSLTKFYGVLEIPVSKNDGNTVSASFRSRENVSIQVKEILERKMETALEKYKMEQFGISKTLLDSVKSEVKLQTLKIDQTGEAKDSSTELYTVLGLFLAAAIYIFIFLYGVQVMRGVIEEKTNRIVEVIVSSVKPFQLMMGKVLGIAMVGLTQIIIWVVLSGILITVISVSFSLDSLPDAEQLEQLEQSGQAVPISGIQGLLSSVTSLNFPLIILTFLFYFAGGYLLYSALFAAVGSAVDSETDTQQFMLPITLPLVFAFVLSSSVVLRDPNGTLAFWLSMFPLTSPVVMMVRLPFLSMPEQNWELGLSMVLLIGTFILTIWLAGRIYRTGILMYGKKATYKELFKWLFYR
jgi:ABC-2 type transport system permease protein